MSNNAEVSLKLSVAFVQMVKQTSAIPIKPDNPEENLV